MAVNFHSIENEKVLEIVSGKHTHEQKNDRADNQDCYQ